MAGGLVTTPLQPYSFNASAGNFFNTTLPASFGYDTGNGSITAWGGNNVVLVPNTGNVILWYYCGSTNAAGIAQVLVGDPVAGQVLPATTTKTIAVNESGWFGPYSPVTYNIANLSLVPTGIAQGPTIASWPAAAQGCYAVAFTLTTQLLVRAYSLSNIAP